jgi:hypothetical protein
MFEVIKLVEIAYETLDWLDNVNKLETKSINRNEV